MNSNYILITNKCLQRVEIYVAYTLYPYTSTILAKNVAIKIHL